MSRRVTSRDITSRHVTLRRVMQLRAHADTPARPPPCIYASTHAPSQTPVRVHITHARHPSTAPSPARITHARIHVSTLARTLRTSCMHPHMPRKSRNHRCAAFMHAHHARHALTHIARVDTHAHARTHKHADTHVSPLARTHARAHTQRCNGMPTSGCWLPARRTEARPPPPSFTRLFPIR